MPCAQYTLPNGYLMISDALCSVYVRLPLIPREGGVDLHTVIHVKSVVTLVFMWLTFQHDHNM